MADHSPFHTGEQRFQTVLGVRDQIEPWARKVVRGSLPEQHREFYAQLPFLVAAARDADDRPWATLLTGSPGFAHAPTPDTLRINGSPPVHDPLAGSLRDGADLGLLGLEFSSRRRNRLNGRIHGTGGAGFDLAVGQAFGNCPQHIHARNWRQVEVTPDSEAPTRHALLTTRFRDVIESADTFFIATGFRGEGESETYGMDASHRGGDPGFVQVKGPQRLVFPDYAGNNHFNTIGNLMMDPRAGLLFVDFETGNLLQLTGRAHIDDTPEDIAKFPGALRLIRFEIDEVLEQEAAIGLRWDSETQSSRKLRIARKFVESENVTSFVLEPVDGVALAPFLAGQHLPVELDIPGVGTQVLRTYSLSNAPGDEHYRISVKREGLGLASRFLHDELEAGDIISTGAPAGDFTLNTASSRSRVLLSAGIGVTPMLSMLHALVHSAKSESVIFLHGARNGSQHALAEEVRRLCVASSRVRSATYFSRPESGDLSRNESHRKGRLDADTLDAALETYDADFYLCGPSSWMATIHEHLEQRGVPLEQIHTESFGPAA